MVGKGPAGSGVEQYGRTAELYDIIHAHKPYRAEAEAVRTVARRGAPRRYRTLLDVACGSGRHLEQFARWFDCTGVDTSPAMLARARVRAPSARLVRGRMEAFDLGQQYDVVTCLFSSIGYVRSVPALRRTVRNFARHTAPGGVVILEPWLTPERIRLGHVHYVVAQGGGTTVIRMNRARRQGARLVLDFHHLVGRRGSVEHFVETHDLGLFDVPTMMSAFRDAGLRVRYLARGLSAGRGLYVGRRPTAPAVRRLSGRAASGSKRRPRRRP